jgi:fructose-bisphosphate aldolase class II
VAEIQRGIRHGVRKINIDTDNRMAMTGEIRRILYDTRANLTRANILNPQWMRWLSCAASAMRSLEPPAKPQKSSLCRSP